MTVLRVRYVCIKISTYVRGTVRNVLG